MKRKSKAPLKLDIDHGNGINATTALDVAKQFWSQLVQPTLPFDLNEHELKMVVYNHRYRILEIEFESITEGHFCLYGLLTDALARERLKALVAVVGPDAYNAACNAAEADCKLDFKAYRITAAQRKQYAKLRSDSQEWVTRVRRSLGNERGAAAHEVTKAEGQWLSDLSDALDSSQDQDSV
jgi:hypothetical protein